MITIYDVYRLIWLTTLDHRQIYKWTMVNIKLKVENTNFFDSSISERPISILRDVWNLVYYPFDSLHESVWKQLKCALFVQFLMVSFPYFLNVSLLYGVLQPDCLLVSSWLWPSYDLWHDSYSKLQNSLPNKSCNLTVTWTVLTRC